MPKLSLLLLLAATLFLIGTSSCYKGSEQGQLPDGEIALTFDDASVDNWHHHLPLLDSLGIKATFYISRYHTFSPAQKQKLKDLQASGHEIAFHTTNHADLPKEVAKNGMAKTEAKEILADLSLMQADGFRITNFAYPYGSNSSELNLCLLRKFKSVRALCNQQNYTKSLVKQSGDWKVIFGANVDQNFRLKNEEIIDLMDKAKERHDCLVLVAHQIEHPGAKFQISRQRLILLAREARQKNIQFVTINQIAF